MTGRAGLPAEDRGIGLCPCGEEADGCDEALDAQETWGKKAPSAETSS